MNLEEFSKQIAIPCVVALAMGVFSVLYNAGTQKTLLEQNIIATAELSKAVMDLRIQMAVNAEKFVTRDELDRRITLVERK